MFIVRVWCSAWEDDRFFGPFENEEVADQWYWDNCDTLTAEGDTGHDIHELRK